MRAASHAHILCSFYKRKTSEAHEDLAAVPRTAPGNEPRQRPNTQKVEPLAEEHYQENNIYHYAEVGRVETEMARPTITGKN